LTTFAIGLSNLTFFGDLGTEPVGCPESDFDKPNILGIECDVASEKAVQNAYKVVIECFGRIDVAVACAGGDG
jgi:NAD(P)-dependent dehydrogenase (short-subunit alcohol dehydrogenase family)